MWRVLLSVGSKPKAGSMLSRKSIRQLSGIVFNMSGVSDGIADCLEGCE